MAVPGEQESFKSQSFSKPSKSTSTSARTGTNFAMAQGKGSMPTKEATRRVFFNNRTDISDDRLERRQKQYDELQAFKQSEIEKGNYVKDSKGNPVRDSKGDYVYTKSYTFDTDSSSPTFGQQVGYGVTDKMQDLALKYGPTFKEIGSDVGYAMGSMAQGVGDVIMSGNIGIIGAIKGVYNYATDKANNAYNSLTDVQKEIADNPNKYTFAEQQEKVKQLKNFRDLASEANKDVLGLAAITAADATDTSAIGGGSLSSFVNEPIGTFGIAGPTAPVGEIDIKELDPLDIGYVESGGLKKDFQKSGILTVDDPTTQEPLSDSTKIPGQNSTIGDFKKALKDQGFDDLQIQSAVNQVTQQILSGEFTGDFEMETGSTTRGSELPNLPGGKAQRELGLLDVINPFDGVPTGMALGEYFNPEMYDIEKFKNELPDGATIPEMTNIITGNDDQASVTQYNNPVNLMDVGQAGATGETYGNGFAVFPDAQTGILAAKNDLAIKTKRYDGNVDQIIGEFAPKSDNPDSFDNYVNFVKQGVGDTVDPGEENELLRRVIQFENKPDIAQQYLAMVAEGGLMDKKMYGGIISSK